MLVGYATVSCTRQDLDGQIKQLKERGCEKCSYEKYSGKSIDPMGCFVQPR
jgi:DNA invertase Pin-like site-specific DNA recombinase